MFQSCFWSVNILTVPILLSKKGYVDYFCYFVANHFSSVWPLKAKRLGMILCSVLPSLCLVVTYESHSRSTWSSCFYGSLRGFLCSEKELGSLLKSNTTPRGKIFIISLNRMPYVWRYFPFEVPSDKVVVLEPASSHFIKLKCILLSILLSVSAIYSGLIIRRSDHFNLPEFFTGKNTFFFSWELLRNTHLQIIQGHLSPGQTRYFTWSHMSRT